MRFLQTMRRSNQQSISLQSNNMTVPKISGFILPKFVVTTKETKAFYPFRACLNLYQKRFYNRIDT